MSLEHSGSSIRYPTVVEEYIEIHTMTIVNRASFTDVRVNFYH